MSAAPPGPGETAAVPGETAAVLALGSNLGDRAREIDAAIAEIADTDGIRLTAASQLVESAAMTLDGVSDAAPRYLNAVVTVATTLTPHELLHQVNLIENAHGRVRDERWGDRTLDIDVVSFAGLRQEDETLTLPHPRAAERAFVLEPWLEIDPDATLPGLGRIDALRATLPDEVTPWPRDANDTIAANRAADEGTDA